MASDGRPRARWALIAALLVARVATAQSPEDRATARLLTQEADRKIHDEDYRAAIDLFTRAYGLVPAPTIKLALGRVRVAMGALVEAQSDLLDAARSAPTSGEPASWGAARRASATEAAGLTGRIPALDIAIDGPPGTVILVDGERLNPALIGAPRAVNPGPHVVQGDAAGYAHAEVSVTLAEGERRQVTLHLTAVPVAPVAAPVPAAAPAAPPPAPAPVAPSPTPAAPPSSSWAPAAPPPGPVPAPTREGARATPDGPRTSTLQTVGFVGAGVLGATWAVTGISSLVMVSNIKSQCHGDVCPPALESQASTAKTLGTVATVCLPLAVVSLGIGLFAPSSATGSARGNTTLTLGAGSIHVQGEF